MMIKIPQKVLQKFDTLLEKDNLPCTKTKLNFIQRPRLFTKIVEICFNFLGLMNSSALSVTCIDPVIL